MEPVCETCETPLHAGVCPRCEPAPEEVAATVRRNGAPPPKGPAEPSAPSFAFAETQLRGAGSPPATNPQRSDVEATALDPPGLETCLASGPDSGAADAQTRFPSGASWLPATPAPQGKKFGRYVLLSVLGHGTMGVVYRAFDSQLGRMVALKQLLREENPELEERFQREARLSARLRHPNVVPVHDVGREEGRLYLAMEFVEGRTLAAWLGETRDLKRAGDPRGTERLRREVEVLGMVADALGHAHALGVVHRDLKPGNILLDREGRPYVTDFGLAMDVVPWNREEGPGAERMTRSGQLLGTPAYMSPEQAHAQSGTIGPRADVWALGVILYEVLTGHLPFGGKTAWDMMAAVKTREPAPPRQLRPEVPGDLERVCMAALVKEPSRRTPTATAFAEDLRRWLKGEPVTASPPGLAYRGARWARRRIAWLTGATVLVLLVGSAIVSVHLEHLREAERRRSALAQGAAAVLRFQREVMRTPMSQDARLELARQPLDALSRIPPGDPLHGCALAWRAWVTLLLEGRDETVREFDRACALSPEAAVPWRLRGLFRLDTYAGLRGLPMRRLGPLGLDSPVVGPETDELRELREGGLADLARAQALDPRDSIEEMNMARALAAGYSGRPGGWEEALRLMGDAVSVRTHRLRGLAFFQLRRFPEAVVEFGHALAEWPQDPDLHFHLAQSLQATAIEAMLRGEDPEPLYGEAIEGYERASRLNSNKSATYLGQQAVAWMELGLSRVARGIDPREVYRKSIVTLRPLARPSSVSPFASFGRLQLGLVLRLLGEAEGDCGGDPRPHFLEAIASLDEEIALFPDNLDARNARGNAWQRQGEYTRDGESEAAFGRALQDFDAAVRMAPDSHQSLTNRASLRVSMARAATDRGVDVRPWLEAAIRDAEAATKTSPGSFGGFQNRAAARLMSAKEALRRAEEPSALLDGAAEDFDAVLALNPRHRSARRGRGQARLLKAWLLLSRNGDAAAALASSLADLEAAARGEDPDATPTWIQALRAAGRVREAIRVVESYRDARGDRAAWARGRLNALEPLVRYEGEPWVALHLAGRDMAYDGIRLVSSALLERALADEARVRERLSPADLGTRAADPGLRVVQAGDRYNLAYAAVLDAAGKTDPRLPAVREVTEVERSAHVDRAFALLTEAVRAFPAYRSDIADDPYLEPLRGDPRFAALLAEGE